MQHLSDEEILAQFAQEDKREQAYTALVKKYQEKLYWHIRRMVMVHDDADDILQNVFLKIWLHLDGFRQDSKLYTWLYRIATNEALTFINKQKSKATTPMEKEEYDLSATLRADPYFEGDELQIRLQEAIASLPDKQRQVFLLRYYDEIKYEEMAEMLGTSVGALKASYHHAAKKIEKYLLSED
ncbi:MAG: RNA polymerase sigma factor [Chitinophagales bacterium]|nr:RNA polymerase sigma factor [Bacteroidota bacterium]MCB9042430.1 RNA polymerase sigma factor [Chitinophagales bacterium]